MVKRILFVLTGFYAGLLQAQTVWQEMPETNIPQTLERQIIPQRYRTVHFDAAALQAVLQTAPERFAGANYKTAQPVLELPLPDGGSARFRLVESPVMAPGLQARYPEIRCYTGFGIDDPGALLKCDWTPWGFHAMVSSNRWGEVFIDPYSHGDVNNYVVYNKKDYLPKGAKHNFNCGVETTEEPAPGPVLEPATHVSQRSNDGQLRRYRLALACTGEYAAFHGGTKPLVLAAMVTSINRVNEVYERDLSVTLQLIATNDTLIFLDPATDPYTNDDGSKMLGQNKTACTNRVGSSNYDIGHVFSTGGGGIAGLGVVCTSNKARGVTGQPAPIGDAFDIDYVAHEMGHQFGANHTQNNSCSRNGATAMEPGSGSTIMGYAGICAPDVQQHSDDYFHGINLEELNSYILQGSGNNCPVYLPNGNTPPTVDAGPDYVIPLSTPFVLTAKGADAGNTQLTYCWEQMDNQTATMPPVVNAKVGPMFRSYSPKTVPYRYFPQLPTVVSNANTQWEKLAAVGRQLNFRVTVRDNDPAGGNTAQDDMTVMVEPTAGPFLVTYPNASGLSWHAGEYQVVTWDVAGTDKAPVNCQTVNILLSTNGGFTYPIALATGIPNNGRACIQVPDTATTEARLMVQAADNIFYDLSNANFTVETAATPAFSMCAGELTGQVCLPNTYVTTVSTSSLLGFDSPVELSASGLPAGAVATFDPNPVAPGATAELRIELPNGLSDGNVSLDIMGVAGADTVSVQSALTLVSNDFSALALLTPANGTMGLSETPVLHWQGVPDADQYDVEVASSPSFALDVLVAKKTDATADTFPMPVQLAKSSVYYWRVRPKNECGPGEWVGPFVFATRASICQAATATDLPKNISGSQASTVESVISIAGNSTISDVNVTGISGNHEFFKDLEVHLISPAGTDVLLFQSKCGGTSSSFNLGFDDNALSDFTCPPVNNGGLVRPEGHLSDFNGQNASGDWMLRVKDNFLSSGGTVTGFNLEVCASKILNPPVLVTNLPLQVPAGANAGIGADLLRATDPDNTDEELVFTLLTTPKHGQLQRYWTGELLPGAQFTQADLNNGGLRYFDYGLNEGADDFCFTVTDGAGGLVQDCFRINPIGTAATEPGRTLDFLLAPNPASGGARIAFGENLASDTQIRIFDPAGRMLRDAVLATGQAGMALDLTGLPKGLYVVTVGNAEGRGVRKLFVY